jgi:hypothetical protein
LLLFLLLLVAAVMVFGGGLAFGFVVFRKPTPVVVEVPERAFAEPIEALQRTIYRFDRQLTNHVETMKRGIDELKAVGGTVTPLAEFLELLAANEEFRNRLGAFATDVRKIKRDLGDTLGGSEKPVDSSPADTATAQGDREPTTEQQLVDMAATDSAPDERRIEQRLPFFCKQWLAPYNGLQSPDADEFVTVQCRDISSGGISFFADQRPAFEMCVIRLCGAGQPKYLTARIKRTAESSHPEHGPYVVGCKFLGTLHRSALPAGVEESIQRREQMTITEELAIA